MTNIAKCIVRDRSRHKAQMGLHPNFRWDRKKQQFLLASVSLLDIGFLVLTSFFFFWLRGFESLAGTSR
jgi:hypothetical protein